MIGNYTIYELGNIIIACAIEVHKNLGPGLLEKCYETCLEIELKKAGLKVERQKALPIYYKNQYIETDYKIDILVENTIVLELKAVNDLNDLHIAQTLTYMKLGGFKKGFLINFNVEKLKDGLKSLIL